MRNFGKGAKLIPGTIVGTVSARNFEVQVGDIWKRHQGQLLPRFIPSKLRSELVRESHLTEQTKGLTPVMRSFAQEKKSQQAP